MVDKSALALSDKGSCHEPTLYLGQATWVLSFAIAEVIKLKFKLRLLLSFSILRQQLHDSIILLSQFMGSQYTTEGIHSSSSRSNSQRPTRFLALGRCSMIFVK